MKLHHLGIAVTDMKKARNAYEALGFAVEEESHLDISRNLNILFMVNGDVRIELLEVADKNQPSPVDKFIDKRKWHNIYHSCYETTCLEKEIENLKDSYVIVEQPKEAPALDGRKVCFLYNNFVGMIELLECER